MFDTKFFRVPEVSGAKMTLIENRKNENMTSNLNNVNSRFDHYLQPLQIKTPKNIIIKRMKQQEIDLKTT